MKQQHQWRQHQAADSSDNWAIPVSALIVWQGYTTIQCISTQKQYSIAHQSVATQAFLVRVTFLLEGAMGSTRKKMWFKCIEEDLRNQ